VSDTYSPASDGPSYSAAWSLAEARCAAKDAARREYLARACRARDPEPEPVRQRAYVGRESARKLSPAMVREVRSAIAAGAPLREVSAWSGLSRPALANLRDGKTYREVE
jgi:hypothetical protein